MGFDEVATAGMMVKLKAAQKAAPVGQARRARMTAEWILSGRQRCRRAGAGW